jgi:fumarate hydratase class II
MCGQAGQLELNVMMPIISHNLNEMMIVMIGRGASLHGQGSQGFDTQTASRLRGWLANNPILVTALNPIIGYNNGATVAKKALAERKSVRQVVLEMGPDDRRRNLTRRWIARQMTEGGITTK